MWALINQTRGECIPFDADQSVVEPRVTYATEAEALEKAADKNRLRADRLIRIARQQTLRAESLRNKEATNG